MERAPDADNRLPVSANMMFSSVIIKTFELFPLLLLPAFFAYSPTSVSAKIQIFMVISALATYLSYPQTGNSIFSSVKDFVVEHPIETAVLSVAVGSPLKYLQHKLRFARINAIKMKYGFTEDPETWENMTVEQAQEIESNMAEWEFPRLWQFAWISDFLRVSP
jgi:hypothetical protein